MADQSACNSQLCLPFARPGITSDRREPAPYISASLPPEPHPERPVGPAPDPLPDLIREAALRLSALGLRDRIEFRAAWNSRMRSTAGRAFHAPLPRIELNPRLRAIAPEEVARTFWHELAHLVAHARAGRHRIEPHGPEWRRACADLGIPGERATHRLPLPRATFERPHQYRCPSCGELLRRVRPIRRPVACLACCRKHNGGKYDERFRFQRVPR